MHLVGPLRLSCRPKPIGHREVCECLVAEATRLGAAAHRSVRPHRVAALIVQVSTTLSYADESLREPWKCAHGVEPDRSNKRNPPLHVVSGKMDSNYNSLRCEQTTALHRKSLAFMGPRPEQRTHQGLSLIHI